MELSAIVVEARRRIADREAQGFELEYVVAFQVTDQALDTRACDFAAAAKLTEADISVVSFHFNHRAHKAPPVRSVAVQQRRFERHGDRRGAYVGNPAWFHFRIPINYLTAYWHMLEPKV